MSRKEAEECFARNTLSYILCAIAPKFKRDVYSEYANKLKQKKNTQEMTPERVKEKRAELLRKLNEG